jgi:hypothetical protein
MFCCYNLSYRTGEIGHLNSGGTQFKPRCTKPLVNGNSQKHEVEGRTLTENGLFEYLLFLFI